MILSGFYTTYKFSDSLSELARVFHTLLAFFELLLT